MVLNNSHDPNELDLISSPVSVASQFGPSLHPRCIWVPFCLCGASSGSATLASHIWSAMLCESYFLAIWALVNQMRAPNELEVVRSVNFLNSSDLRHSPAHCAQAS